MIMDPLTAVYRSDEGSLLCFTCSVNHIVAGGRVSQEIITKEDFDYIHDYECSECRKLLPEEI